MNTILNTNSDKIFRYAKGCYLYTSGAKYIDLCCGNGTHIFGHQKIQVDDSLYAATSHLHKTYGDLLREFTGMDNFVLCNSGAEATMKMARIARAYTGKDRIMMFKGGWHGSGDTYLQREGVPKAVQDLIIHADKDESCFPLIKDLAMVIIEPVQGIYPECDPDFLKELYEVCKKNGVLLAFDEVLTGFRLAKGGAKELFDLDCDLVSYGKIAGGGLPIGIVGGKEHILKKVGSVASGGTFSGNSATLRMGTRTLLDLLELDPYESLNKKGECLRRKIECLSMELKGIGSMSKIISKGDTPKEVFIEQLLSKQMYISPNGYIFLSTEHDYEVIATIVERINNAIP